MAGELKTVHVTHHALQRWRERVAQYANAKVGEIEEAVKAAIPIGDDDPLPATIVRTEGTRYYRHVDKPNIYFITEPRTFVRGERSEAVITVIDTSSYTKANDSQRATERELDYPTPPQEAPAYRDVGEQRDWYLAELTSATSMLAVIPKGHPQRKDWVNYHQQTSHKMASIKRDYRAHKHQLLVVRQKEAAEEARQARELSVRPVSADGVHLANGRIDLSAAVRLLLKKVEWLEAEIEVLKLEQRAA